MNTASTVPMVGPTTAPGPPPGAVTDRVTASNAAVTGNSHRTGRITHASMTSGNSSQTNASDSTANPTHNTATTASHTYGAHAG